MNTISSKFRKNPQQSQTTIEYLLLFALTAVIVFVGVRTILPKTTEVSQGYFNKTARGIMGDPLASAICGDGSCNGFETCSTCPSDCGACPPPVCKDGRCVVGEDCSTCPDDCGICPATCNNGICDPGIENCNNCQADCGACPSGCGDGICLPGEGEGCDSCPVDCGACPPGCGDGICSPGSEVCMNCPRDCGICSPVCRDGNCDLFEDCVNCPDDCGACSVGCNDGICDATETCVACPLDCGVCRATGGVVRFTDDNQTPVYCRSDEFLVGGGCYWREVEFGGNDELRDRPLNEEGSTQRGGWMCIQRGLVNGVPSRNEENDTYAICLKNVDCRVETIPNQYEEYAQCDADEYLTGGGCYWEEVSDSGDPDRVHSHPADVRADSYPPNGVSTQGGRWVCESTERENTYAICCKNVTCRTIVNWDKQTDIYCAADEFLTGGGCYWREVEDSGDPDDIRSHPVIVSADGSSLGAGWRCRSRTGEQTDTYAVCCK